MQIFTLILIAASFFASANPINVAILDSGVDYKHEKLDQNVWINPNEYQNNRDDDQNSYVDDFFGWNFIEESPEVFNFSLHGTFESDIFKYYRIKAKRMAGTASEQEEAWYKKMLKDDEFKERRKKFTSYIHGTHITGLAVSNVPRASKYVIVKYLGKAEKGLAKEPEFSPLQIGSRTKKINHVKNYIKQFVKWQLRKLKTAVDYVGDKASVLNGSFGKSFKGTRSQVSKLYEKQFDEDFLEDNKSLITNDALYLLREIIKGTEKIARENPKILFVFSAGNKKEDTDTYLHYPSNARATNIISVGASDPQRKLAYFSNFGKNTVDILAPGISVKSTIPNNGSLKVNGTSQAAPQVSNLALKLLRKAKQNRIPVTIGMIKRIILETGDYKNELEKKTTSSSIINPARAMRAVELLKRNTLYRAIERSQREVKDIPAQKAWLKHLSHENYLIDLPEPF